MVYLTRFPINPMQMNQPWSAQFLPQDLHNFFAVIGSVKLFLGLSDSGGNLLMSFAWEVLPVDVFDFVWLVRN
jgi:hypothetical protein